MADAARRRMHHRVSVPAGLDVSSVQQIDVKHAAEIVEKSNGPSSAAGVRSSQEAISCGQKITNKGEPGIW